MNKNVTSFHADAWHAAQNNLDSSKQPLHIYNSENMPISLKQFSFCPFLNHWINFWIALWVFRAQLGLICVQQIQVWLSNPIVTFRNASFHCFNSRSDGLRCDFSTNKLSTSINNIIFRNFNSKSDGLRFDSSTNKLKYSSYLSTLESRGILRSPSPSRFCSQTPSSVYPIPSEVSAILCEPCSWKTEIFFSATAKFLSLISGDL